MSADQPTPDKRSATNTATNKATDAATAKSTASTQSKPTASKPAKAPSQSKSGGGLGRWLAVFVLLLVLGGASVGGWFGWQQWVLWQDGQQARQQYLTELQDQLARQATQIENLERSLEQVGQAQQGVQSNLQDTQQNLATLAQQVNADSGLQESDVQRLEIEYLLRTARHISQLTRDLAQSSSLLQQADRMLAEIDEVAYLPAREALAQDLQALRNTPMPDIDGIYFELRALEQSARQWQWWPQSSDSSIAEEDAGTPDETTTWYGRMATELRSLVTVRYRGDLAQARLTPDEFNQMRAQFRMLLQQAQVAALQRNQLLYDSSLEQAQEWLNDASGQVPNLTGLQAQLEQLRSQSIETVVPEIDRALTALRAINAAADNDDDTDTGDAE
ncbi:MAG: uroporphyrinogen-III C-methyltransferase [Natronospirillum sp.]